MKSEFVKRLCGGALLLAIVLIAMPGLSLGAGGGGGGGGGSGGSTPKPIVYQGTITAINLEAGTITIGTSYYLTGQFRVDSSTKVVRAGANSTLELLNVGEFISAKVDPKTRIADKIEALGSS